MFPYYYSQLDTSTFPQDTATQPGRRTLAYDTLVNAECDNYMEEILHAMRSSLAKKERKGRQRLDLWGKQRNEGAPPSQLNGRETQKDTFRHPTTVDVNIIAAHVNGN